MARQICAWCEKEGRETVLGPSETERDSHGICSKHMREEMRKIDQEASANAAA